MARSGRGSGVGTYVDNQKEVDLPMSHLCKTASLIVVLVVGLVTSAIADPILSFPLPNRSPDTAVITAVFDHSMDRPYCPDGVVTAFTGETGRAQYGGSPWYIDMGCGKLRGYRGRLGIPFVVNGHYRSGQDLILFYDGHPAYDLKTVDQGPRGRIKVLAAAPGQVKLVGGKYGIIEIDHGNGWVTRYIHLDPSSFKRATAKVSNGQWVERCQVIGIAGDTGAPGAPHLHFEIRKDGIPVDPYGWQGSFPDPYTKAVNVNLWGAGNCPQMSATDEISVSDVQSSTQNTEISDAQVRVFDLSGRLILSANVASQDSVGSRLGDFVPSLPNGVYFYVVTSRKNGGIILRTEVKKLVVRH